MFRSRVSYMGGNAGYGANDGLSYRNVRAYEEQAGKEPFEATVVKRGKAYFFA